MQISVHHLSFSCKRLFLFISLFFFLFEAKSQTTLISPTGDGGFETGATFAANGWQTVNHSGTTNSNWFLTSSTLTNGAVSFVPSGARAAYISNNNGTNWQYNTLPVASTSHIYKDITFPAGESIINLSFRWAANGEINIGNPIDVMYVYLCPQTLMPVTGSPASTSSVPSGWAGTGNAMLLGTFQLQPSGTTSNVQIPSAIAGNCTAASNMRLVFSWKNDVAGTSLEPPAALDDISLTSDVAPAPLMGSKTVGVGGDYSNLTLALAALYTNGQSGPITFDLTPTYTSATEIFPLILSPTCSNVIIRPDTGTTNAIITSASTTSTIDIQGGTKWILEGRAGGLGTSKELTIDNSNTAGIALRFINEASTDTVRYCKIKGVNTGATGGVVVFSTTTFPNGNGNDNNTIEFCDISAGATTPTNGVYSGGTTTFAAQANSGNRIMNNNIFDYFVATGSNPSGVFLNGAGSQNWVISGNSFYETASRTFTAGVFWNGVQIAGGGINASGVQILNNYIGGTAPLCGGTAMTLLGAGAMRCLLLTVGTATPTSVQGNTIQNISLTSSGGSTSQSAMSLVTGSFNVGNITGNTIGSQTANGSLTFTYTGTLTTNAPIFSGILAGTGTPGVMNIQNNTIGGISCSASSTGVVNMRGIHMQGTVGSYFVDNNIIGSLTQTNSLSNSTPAQSHGIISLYGGTVAANNIISNNTVANVTATNAGTNAIFYGIYLQGSGTPPASIGTIQIIGNTVRNLTTSTAATNVATAAILININSPGQVIANNTVHTIRNIATATAGQATGVYFTGGALATASFTKNNIHSLSIANTLGTIGVSGILCSTGVCNFSNNMIRLGIDAAGANLTNAMVINGIYDASLGSNFYHNSIYVGGTGVGTTASNTFAFNSTAVTNPRSFINNIFVNERSNATTGGGHYAIQVAGTAANPAGLTANYNLYNATGTGGVLGRFNAINQATLAAWKTATGVDINSLTGNPEFINPTGSSSTLDLHISTIVPTPVEQAGYGGIASIITDDIDNSLRSGLTPVDIGADAGNFIIPIVDLTPPVITYSLIPNTCATGDVTFSANIVDNTGVATAGGNEPRVYYKKSTSGTWISQAGTLTSGTALNGVWSFTISSAAMGGVVAPDIIQYYVVAQDIVAIPNLGSTAINAVGTDVNSISVHPSNPFSYNITYTLNGTYTVGVGQFFPTLTAAVNAYNISCLGGPVLFSLRDATYPSETFPITILQNPAASSVNTLTIKPATGITPALTGTNALAILRSNGGEYITIDGSNTVGGTSKDFTISNTNATGVVVWISSSSNTDPALNNTLKNCNILGVGSGTIAGVLVGSSAAIGNEAESPNNNLTIQNNSIAKVSNGIYFRGNSVSFDQNINIIGNTLGSTVAADKITNRGILIGNVQNFMISDNIINGVTSSTTNVSTTGVQVAFSVANGSILRNKISDIKHGTTYGASGILLGNANTNANLTVANNFIWDIASANGFGSGVGSVTVNNNGYGMILTSGGGYKIYYNTIFMNTSQTGGTPCAVNITNGITATASIDLRNNIIINNQTTPTRYALYCEAPSSVFSTIDYNDYWINTGGNLAFLGVAMNTISDIQVAFGGNTNSLNINPTFVSNIAPVDLHLVKGGGVNCQIKGKATPIPSITDDIDIVDTRSTTQPGMGADEFPDKILAVALSPFVVCQGTTLNLNATGSGTAPLVYGWTGVGGFTSPLQNAAIGNAQPINSGTYTVTVTDFYNCVEDSAKTYTVNPEATANAGPDQTVCGQVPITLAGTFGGAATSGSWSGGFGTYNPNSTTGNAIYTPHISEVGTNRILTWTTNDPDGVGPCSAVDAQVTLFIHAPATANAGTDQAFCGNNAFLSATANNTGSWTGGLGSFLASANTNTTYTAGSGETSATLTWTTIDPDGAGPCTAANDDIIVSFSPPATANAGTDQTICGSNAATLNATIGGAATSGSWLGGFGNYSSTTSGTSTYSPHPSEYGTTVSLAWTSNDPDGLTGPCNAITDFVDITIDAPVNPIAGANQTSCGAAIVTMSPTTPSIGVGVWTGGLGTWAGNDYTPSAGDAASGATITATWTVTNGLCVATSTATIIINGAVSADAGANQSSCGSGTVIMSPAPSGIGTGTWSGGAGAWSGSVYTPSAGEASAGATITATWTVTNGICVATDTTTITIYQVVTSLAGPNQTSCGSAVVTMSPITPSIGTGAWSGGAGTWSGNDYTPSVSEATTGATIMTTWTVTNGPCSAISTTPITISAPISANAGANQASCGAAVVTMSPTTPSIGAGVWTGGAGTWAGNDYTPNPTEASAGATITATWTVTNGTCVQTATATITIDGAVTATAGANQTSCGAAVVTMSPTTPSIGTGVWTGGAGTWVGNDYTPSPTEASAGATITATWTVTNGLCVATGTATITISGAVSANAGANQASCGAAVVTMSPTTPSIGTGVWTGGAGTWAGNDYTPSPTEASAGATITATWTVTNGTCVQTATATITINIVPAMLTTSAAPSCGSTALSVTSAITGSLEWRNNSNPSLGAVVSTANPFIATVSGTYYAFDVSTASCYSAAATQTTGSIQAIPTAVAAQGTGLHSANTECTDALGWTHYWEDPTPASANSGDEVLLLSIDKTNYTGAGLGILGATLQIQVNASSGYTIIQPDVTPPLNYANQPWPVMNRYWKVTPLNEPTPGDMIPVRFYYTMADYMQIPGVTAPTDLDFYKVNDILTTYNVDPTTGHPDMPLATTFNADGFWLYQHASNATTSTWTGGSHGADFYADMLVGHFGGGGGGSPAGPLPINLVSFTGYNDDLVNVLNWETSAEINAERFDIFRSSDNNMFEKIGEKAAKGSTSQGASYEFVDKQPLVGTNYYQLKFVDVDGKQGKSNIVAINTNANLHYTIYPNPTKDKLNISISGFTTKARLEIYNSIGQLIQNKELNPKDGTIFSMDVSTLSQGVYLYQLKYQGDTFLGKFVKE